MNPSTIHFIIEAALAACIIMMSIVGLRMNQKIAWLEQNTSFLENDLNALATTVKYPGRGTK